jgi:hypothetical protein
LLIVQTIDFADLLEKNHIRETLDRYLILAKEDQTQISENSLSSSK